MPAEIVRIAFHKNGRIAQLVRAHGTAMYCEGRRSESCSFHKPLVRVPMMSVWRTEGGRGIATWLPVARLLRIRCLDA